MLKKILKSPRGDRNKKPPLAPAPALGTSTASAASDEGSPSRFRTHLSTDKPIYKPDDTVYIRGVILNAFTLEPYSTRPGVRAIEPHLAVKSPKGDKVVDKVVGVENGVVSASWKIPSGQSGGDFTAIVEFPYDADFATAEMQFNVRVYRPPRLNTQLKFMSKAYGEGDTAIAKLEVVRAEGGHPVGAKVTAVARIDGAEAYRGDHSVDAHGVCMVRFPLPDAIDEGDGTLNCTIEDGGVVETASKTIPIVLKSMDVSVFPEGGELAAGVPNRIYVEAHTRTGDPADMEANIVSSKGEIVGTIKTTHEGRGKAEFTPKSKGKYHLDILKPSGVTKPVALPAISSGAVALRALKDTYENDSVGVKLGAASKGEYRVDLCKHDTILASSTIELDGGETKDCVLTIPAEHHRIAQGVLRVTVYTAAKGKPIAERVVFRTPHAKVDVRVEPDKSSYCPGGKAALCIRCVDAGSGAGVKAVVGVTVTDESVLEMVEKRKQAALLPVMALLQDEVDHIEDNTAYLPQFISVPPRASDAEAPNPEVAVDLLLGTQGWRRFARTLEDIPGGKDKAKGKAERLLVTHQAKDRPRPVRRKAGRGRGGGGGGLRFGAAPGGAAPRRAMMMEMAMPVANGAKMAPPAAPLADALAPPAPPPAVAAAAPPAPAAAFACKEEAAVLRPQMDKRAAAAPRAGKAMKKKKKRARRRDDLFLDAKPAKPVDPVVRVYAHQVRPGRKPNDRVDFTETIYWCAYVETDDSGVARIEFDLNDSVTSFSARADAYTTGGALGGAVHKIESKEPFYTEPKMPLEVTSGDKVLLPIALVNGTEDSLGGTLCVSAPATLLPVPAKKGKKGKDGGGDGDEGPAAPEVQLLHLDEGSAGDVDVKLSADQRDRHLVAFEVGQAPAHGLDASLVFSADVSGGAAVYTDRVTRTTRVVPAGFPESIGWAGTLEPDSKVACTFTIPEKFVPGSGSTSTHAYPTPASSLAQALSNLIRTPSGCFEQTSMTSYPLVMAQTYFKSHSDVDPSYIERADTQLSAAYKRLTGYECSKGGYEWFGGDPGHEALTAYGLMQFTDMRGVRPVDEKMLERTTKWLLGRRDGNGGFKRNSRALDSFGRAPDFVTDAYIVWALVEAGHADQLGKEIDGQMKRHTGDGNVDAYFLGCMANALLGAGGMAERAAPLLDALEAYQKEDGSIDDEETTITRSGGDSKVIETTSLAVLAWLRAPTPNMEAATRAMRYLTSKCRNGSFGSTQGTVLALKAIVAYDKFAAAPTEGAIVVYVDGEEVTSEGFGPSTIDTITFPSFADALSVGEHTMEIEMVEGSRLPFSVHMDYFAIEGESSSECVVDLDVSLASHTITEGEGSEITVSLGNRSKKHGQPMTIAIVGLPGGLEPRHDQLKELVSAGTVDFYETFGARELVFYWRDMKPEFSTTFKVDVVAAVPGTYTAPASRAYLYYTEEHKTWVSGLKCQVVPK